MRRPALLLLAAAGCLAVCGSARAEGIDGSTPLVCDLVQAAQCDGMARCEAVTLDEIGLPPVLHIDFAKSQLATVDEQRTSPIKAVEKLDNVVVLQGNQNGRGWAIVLDRATGHLSASVAGAEGAFVVAGACTAR